MADVKLEMSDSTADALSQDGHLQARSTSSTSLRCCCLCHTGNQAVQSNRDAPWEDVKSTVGGVFSALKSRPRLLSRSFICCQCGEKFSRADLLTHHLETHSIQLNQRTVGCQSELMSFFCGWCRLAFTTSSEFRSHLDVRHSDIFCNAPETEKSPPSDLGGRKPQTPSEQDTPSEHSTPTAQDTSSDVETEMDEFSQEYTESRVKAEPFQEDTDKDSAIVSRENSEEFLPQTQTEGTNQVLASQNMKFVNPDYTCKHPHEKSFQCKDCDKHFFASSSLAKHIIKEHPEHKDSAEAKPHECQVCSKRFTRKETWQHHVYTHTKDKPFKCEKCDKTFIRRSALTNHMRISHASEVVASGFPRNETPAKARPYICEICSRHFARKDTLRQHVFYTHTEDKPLKCKECNASFGRRNELTEHMRKFHALEETASDLEYNGLPVCRSHACQLCNESFRSKKTLHHHMFLKHEQHSNFRCTDCKASFTHYSELNEHFHTVHAENKQILQCDKCPKLFSSSSGLNQHNVQQHTRERPYVCEHCGRTFARKGNWQLHVNTHTGEKPFKCKECDACFASPSTAGMHRRRIHTKERPCICDQCGKRFPSSGSLKRHMMRHTDSRPFMCSQCGKRFRAKTHLAYHTKTHTQDNKAASLPVTR